MNVTIAIDGSYGEGGGQIIRSALALSLITGKPFRVDNIRAGRKNPGLQQQHLASVNAAARIGGTNVEGAYLGSSQFTFVPQSVTAGNYHFSVGTAGSTTLVLQTVLPALMIASAKSNLTIEGGTHNPLAPPFDFLERAFLPLVNRMGPSVSAKLVRYGFYPPGGGQIKIGITPSPLLKRLELNERGQLRAIRAKALVVNLPRHIAAREIAVVRSALSEWSQTEFHPEVSNNAPSPGNAVTIDIESEQLTEVFTALGKRGVPAEAVAEEATREAKAYLTGPATVGANLADQLLLPMAMAGGGSFTSGPLSSHCLTNIAVIKNFLDVEITASEIAPELWAIKVTC